MTNTGASVVIHFIDSNKNVFILVGNESNYLREQSVLNGVPVVETDITEKETFTKTGQNHLENQHYAKLNFFTIAEQLSK